MITSNHHECAIVLDGADGNLCLEMKLPRRPASQTSTENGVKERVKGPKPASTAPLDPGQIRLLRQSFALVEPQAGIAGLVFYRNLFTLDPSLRGLFHTSIELQGRKLMEALSFTLATLENPKALVPELEAMGRRHVTYGARDEHYDTVLRAMMLTLKEVLRAAFTVEVRQAWTQALEFVAGTMKRGAAPTAALRRDSNGR